MTRKKRVLAVALAAAVLRVIAFAVTAAKDQTYVPSEAAAREIARTFNAPIARIDADYPRSFRGQGKAISDAKSQALPHIKVEPIDLAAEHHLEHPLRTA